MDKAPVDNIAFADESGTSSKEKCYAIGALFVPAARYPQFEEETSQLVKEHGVVGEVKWTKIGASHGPINLGIDVAKRILKSKCCFSAIVVKKDLYNKWRGNKEEAFYTTYTQLIEHAVRSQRAVTRVYIDNRSDSYDRQDEVLEIVANRMLAKLSSAGRIDNVIKVDSKKHVLLQVADLLTGAINTAHHRYLNPNWCVHPGKNLCISRLAAVLGWDDLKYDTYPSVNFNVWHFPTEYRRSPRTRKVIPNYSVNFVTADELRNCIAGASSPR